MNTNDLTPEQMGPQIGEVTMRPGDVLYVRSGVPHICETAANHSLHLSFDLCDRTPTVEYQLQMALGRYKHATPRPTSPAPGGRRRVRRAAPGSREFRGELEQRAEALRASCALSGTYRLRGQGDSLSRYSKRVTL